MAIRYRQEMINLAGVYFKVEILDTDYVGSVLDFHLKDFEIDWKGQSSERDNFILGSECIVMAQSTATLDLNTLINDIREAEEGRFQVAIYKKETVGGNYTLYWVGMVLNDLSGGEDAAPVQHFDIVATDGLGALKGIDYKVDSTTAYGDLSAASHLLNCLKKIPYNSFFSASSYFLYEILGVYESAMANTTDSVLNRVQIPSVAFYTKDKNDNYDWKSCYEVLLQICLLFKARLYLDNGIWRFYELYSLENVSNISVNGFLYDGTDAGVLAASNLRTTLTGGFSGGNRVEKQRFAWLPALKEVRQVFKHDSSHDLLKNITLSTTTGQQRVLDAVANNNTEYFLFTGTLNVSIVESPVVGVTVDVYVKLRMLLKVDPYYYERTVYNANQNVNFDNGSWASAGYVEFIIVETVNFSANSSVPIIFRTDPFISNGPLDMNLEIVYIRDAQQNDISGSYNVFAYMNNTYLEYVDGDAENEHLYRSYNNVSSFYSSVLEFPDMLCGDRINPLTPSSLSVYDGSEFVESSGNWERGGLNGSSTLLQLTLNEFLAGQRKFIEKRQGSFIGKFPPLLPIGLSSKFYLPLRIRFSANDAVYNGEWYLIDQFNDFGISVIDTPVTFQNRIPPSVLNPAGQNNTVAKGVIFNNGKISVEKIDGTRTVAVELNSGTHNFLLNSLGIGVSNQYACAILHTDSTERGFLPPRMTESQRNKITSPVEGLLIWQTDGIKGLYGYSGTDWDKV